jgi:SAM-dependent methyltransferase
VARDQKDRLSDYHLLSRTYVYICKRLHRETVKRLAPHLRGTLVDVGCGHGVYRPLFIGTDRYVGLDTNERRRPDVVADAHVLPLSSSSADSAVCTEVLEHVRDPDAVMSEVARVLKVEGLLLLTTPMSWNLHYEPNDFRRYTSYGLWQLLDKHGFQPLETCRIGGLFSLVGSRLVDAIAMGLWRRLHFLPRRIRHAVILCYSIPMSLLFSLLARIGDDFEKSDAIAWAVLARRQ